MREVPNIMDTDKIHSECLNGVYNDIASLLGIDAALKMHLEFRGQQVTFPVQLFSRAFISQQIIAEYDGHNVPKLATKYGYSEKWIRKIIKENKIEVRKQETEKTNQQKTKKFLGGSKNE